MIKTMNTIFKYLLCLNYLSIDFDTSTVTIPVEVYPPKDWVNYEIRLHKITGVNYLRIIHCSGPIMYKWNDSKNWYEYMLE